MTTADELEGYTRADDLRDLHAWPRYLAGTGADLDTAIRPLHQAGFDTLHGTDGEVFLHSPCHRITAAWTRN